MSVSYKKLANAIRTLSLDAISQAKSGHIGICLGIADVVTVLFKDFLKFYSSEPNWLDRDRFILSAGHGSMLLYSLLYLTGYKDISIEDIKNFRQLGAKTAGHPEYGLISGIEATTGPLGQGIANAAGMALTEKILSARFSSLVDHYTYVLVGDGCLMEGISQEVISFAGHHKLNKLIVLFDSNKISIDGDISLVSSEDITKRFEACNWHVVETDGHDYSEIKKALDKAKNSNKPSLVICNTIIGYGAKKEGESCMHAYSLSKEEVAVIKAKLNCKINSFEIEEDILTTWRDIGKKGQEKFQLWSAKLNNTNEQTQKEFLRTHQQKLKPDVDEIFHDTKRKIYKVKPNEATRTSSGNVLEKLTSALPELIGGAADLTQSICVQTKSTQPISDSNPGGNYIYYGIREHAMAAIMNGMSLHKGVIPYGGTFLIFSDYCRPSIRLAALMKQKVVYVFTHDSIGVGEDGSTHQPIEQIDTLRLIPDLLVMRPCDACETTECWQIALTHNGPSVFCLSRQKLPFLTKEITTQNRCRKGAYVISPEQHKLDYTIIATGSEVQIAIDAQKELEKANISIRVVSAPCLELFFKQDLAYRKQVLGTDNIIAIEASTALSFYKITPHVISLNSFGVSGKKEDLFKYFNITKEALINFIKKA
jgi:transketolase